MSDVGHSVSTTRSVQLHGHMEQWNSPFPLEVLHDIQEVVVNLWLIRELSLNSIQVLERVVNTEMSFLLRSLN